MVLVRSGTHTDTPTRSRTDGRTVSLRRLILRAGLPLVDGGHRRGTEVGVPTFRPLCQRILNRDRTIPLALVVFDILSYVNRMSIRDVFELAKELGALETCHQPPALPPSSGPLSSS